MAKVRINRRREYREQLRLYLSMSKPLSLRLSKFFTKQSSIAQRQYEINELIGREYFENYWEELYLILKQHHTTVIETISERMSKGRLTKAVEDETVQEVYDYVTTSTAQGVTYITETTKKQIQSAIAFGISEGLSVVAIAKVVQDSTAFSKNRAKVIARTETHTAMNYGSYKVAKRLSLKKPIKEWLSALDDRTRHWHRSMSGQRKLIEDDFVVFTPIKGGSSMEVLMKYPGDELGGSANIINCRCFAIYSEEEDLLE